MRKLVLILALILFPARSGFAGELYFDPKVTPGEVGGTFTLLGADAKRANFTAEDSLKKESLDVSAEAKPVDLWILVDASQMCVAEKVDAYLPSLIGMVEDTVGSGSRVSLVSFKNPTVLIHSQEVAPHEVEPKAVRCDAKVLSASFEAALNALLDTRSESRLPTKVWILSSGNTQLSEATERRIREAKLEIQIVLYNPILEAEIRGRVGQMAERLRPATVRFSLLAQKEKRIPARWFNVAIESPNAAAGTAVPVTFTAKTGGAEVAKSEVSLIVPDGTKLSFFRRNERWLPLIGLGLVLLALGYGLYRYYRARFCKSCGKRRRHTDKTCLFCLEPNDALLVGEFGPNSRRRLGQSDVVVLTQRMSELGTHRKSRVRLKRQKTPKGRLLAGILREERTGFTTYQLLPKSKGAVRINGRLIDSARYLAVGDEIELDGTKLAFMSAKAVEMPKESR